MTSRSPSPVELWYSHRGGPAATPLAARKGWLHEAFADGGTKLRSLDEADSRDIRLAYFHHGQTGLIREGGNVPAIWARAEGQEAVVVAITWVDEYQGILVRRDSGIRTLADLRGCRLGLPTRRRALVDSLRASAQRGFATALGLAGPDDAGVNWTDIERSDVDVLRRAAVIDEEVAALRAGSVDAVFVRGIPGYAASRDPALYEILDLNREADPLRRVNNGTPRPITVDRTFLDRHPDIVRRYLAVLVRAARWAGNHAGEVTALFAADNPGYRLADVTGAHGPNLHRNLLPSLNPLSVAGLAQQKRFLLDWGYIRQDFDIAQWIDPAPLDDVLRARHAHSTGSVPHAARWIAPREQPQAG